MRDLSQLSQSMAGVLADPNLQNIHAQGHARAILNQLETPEEQWPAFRRDLDERLVYSANFMISYGLDLKDVPDYQVLANQLLSRGAEALEYLCDLKLARVSVADELLKAAVAYQIADYHARSYVLMQKLDGLQMEGDVFSGLIKALMQRDLKKTRYQSFIFFDQPDFDDASISGALYEGSLPYDDAIAHIGRRCLAEAVSSYLEYLKTGNNDLVDAAVLRCRDVANLGRDAYHVDLWWWGRALERMLKDLGSSSMWSGLKDLSPDQSSNIPIQRYIESHVTRNPAITTLWPSQRKALALVKSPDLPSFCVRMPTSAGKTKIAELAIVKTICDNQDEDDSKCIYIAPFRSLAIEIEETLRKNLQPLGIGVSEIYGGFDISVTEEILIQNTQVLIATPEKFDAVIRLVPDLLDGVRLIIFDEGHLAGDISERGIRAEFLLNRLLYKLGRERCRYIFISAVLPNPDDFAKWIGRDTANMASSEWRPSRMVLGQCLWNGKRVRLVYSHESSTRLEQEVFVNRFVNKTKVKGLSGAGARQNPFPNDVGEAFASTAVRFAQYGSTLAFVPQARQVEPTARRILTAIRLMRAITRKSGHEFIFPTPDESSQLMQECLTAIKDELGEDAAILAFIQSGIAIHHGNLPTRVRLSVERLVRAGEIKLIVATTTLGQGINLPIRTVLVRGLQYSQHERVDPMSFWNIAGRAGRAMHDNEGQILFFIDETRPPGHVSWQKRNARELIERSSIQIVVGFLHRAIAYLRKIWRSKAPHIDFDDLCLKLAEDDFDWSTDDDKTTMSYIFQLIDQHLLAVAVEADFGPDQPDRLQEVLRESLLFTQLEAHPIEDIDFDSATSILSARLRWIYRKVPEQNRRVKFYSIGMPLDDCARIEQSEDIIIGLLKMCENWLDITKEDQMKILLRFTEEAMQLDTIVNRENILPIDLPRIIEAWLSGQRCIDMIDNGMASEFSGDVGRLSRFLERICVYGISWAVNGFISYAKQRFEEDGNELPIVAEFLPSMFKIGVNNPVAAIIAPYLQLDRRLSLLVAKSLPLFF